ncbi:hypothetical protein GIB67_004172 [Kingdonia uniflora]|uniref:FCP1 homology domain-containing protein n=1 Tax=Kingdonia uniflora TaxID=39325 RepID=A0A7J7LLZ7_9MAGN|nr:hypothetical protein GIB67_004172 [Kingdonia uniflora]
MPALKMKAKSSTVVPREGNCLGVCGKSSNISKKSCSQIKISQQAAALETSADYNQNNFSTIEVSVLEHEFDENVEDQEIIDSETCQFENLPSFSADSPSVVRTDILLATCSSNLETIFSPIFEFIEGRSDVYNYTESDLEACTSNDRSRSSCDYQACSISDFYISDMSVTDFPFDGYTGFDDILEAINPFPDYESINHNMMFDISERYMILPFLDESTETRCTQYGNPCEETLMNSDEDESLYLAIQQMASSDQEFEVDSHSPNTGETEFVEPHLFIRNLPDLSDVVNNFWPISMPKETQKRKPITIVLDLDETLVHSTLDQGDDADFTFPVFFNMKEHTVYVRQRPYLHIFLERVAEMFEIIIFTASQSTYAEQLLNILDPEGKFISRRAFRESCIFSDGSYIKDLTVLGIDLAKVAIIDNSPQVFRLQVNNGIPIKSWYDDPSDRALTSLLPFLETLVDVDDVRPIIENKFSKE